VDGLHVVNCVYSYRLSAAYANVTSNAVQALTAGAWNPLFSGAPTITIPSDGTYTGSN